MHYFFFMQNIIFIISLDFVIGRFCEIHPSAVESCDVSRDVI